MKSISSWAGPVVPYDRLEKQVNWAKEFGRRAPLDVEIGFGLGEFLVKIAAASPQRNFLGIEADWPRIAKALTRVERFRETGENSSLNNIRVIKLDAKVVFKYLFKPREIDNIYCLFPCPWPKKGHIKYRLFAKNFLILLNNRLKTGGQIKLVTDYLPYLEWVLAEAQDAGFSLARNTISARYDTKYERKWSEAGQKEFYEIIFTKQKHRKVAEPQKAKMKAYKVKQFNPEKFNFEDKTGEVAVVAKDFLFDAKKARGQVFLIVAEGDLTQYFRVLIDKRGDYWRVCKADGQNIFPTPGLALALEMVYQEALNTV